MIAADSFQKFLFEKRHIRGEWVRLGPSFRQAVGRHQYPSIIQDLLGQASAAVVLLTGTLKFEGRLSLQALGAGPITMFMAEANNHKEFRCIANDDGSQLEGEALPSLLGAAQLAITIDPSKGQRYQGIVPLEHDSLSECLAQYFALSEQLDTHFLLATDDQDCYGLMLQKLPDYRDIEDQDAWNRILQLANTLELSELKASDNETLMHRLFHEEELLVFAAEEVSFRCSCSRERSLGSIQSLGAEEALDILESEAVIAVDCQFCNKHYEFDRQDISTLFGLGRSH